MFNGYTCFVLEKSSSSSSSGGCGGGPLKKEDNPVFLLWKKHKILSVLITIIAVLGLSFVIIMTSGTITMVKAFMFALIIWVSGTWLLASFFLLFQFIIEFII